MFRQIASSPVWMCIPSVVMNRSFLDFLAISEVGITSLTRAGHVGHPWLPTKSQPRKALGSLRECHAWGL